MREIAARDHGLHARQRLGRAGVDGPNPGVRVRAAQDRAGQHAGGDEVRPVQCFAGHLVDPVGPHRAGADNAEFAPEFTPEFAFAFGRVHAGILSKLVSWRSSAAAASTARTILS